MIGSAPTAVGPITGVVLCGGGGRRFDGRDKPLEVLDGRPLVAHVIDRIAPQVDDLIISANRNKARYEQFGYPVVADAIVDRGPLAGIEAAAAQTSCEWLLVCPGDTPLMPIDLVGRLRSVWAQGVDVVVPHDGERAQHLFMLLRATLVASISTYLDKGGRSVGGWLAELEVAECGIDNPAAFTNVNTADDLAALSSRWHPLEE